MHRIERLYELHSKEMDSLESLFLAGYTINIRTVAAHIRSLLDSFEPDTEDILERISILEATDILKLDTAVETITNSPVSVAKYTKMLFETIRIYLR